MIYSTFSLKPANSDDEEDGEKLHPVGVKRTASSPQSSPRLVMFTEEVDDGKDHTARCGDEQEHPQVSSRDHRFTYSVHLWNGVDAEEMTKVLDHA